MYILNPNTDKDDLIDGRTVLYLSKKLHFNRENLAKILNGTRACSIDRANQIVSYCKPNESVDDYFIKVKEEG